MQYNFGCLCITALSLAAALPASADGMARYRKIVPLLDTKETVLGQEIMLSSGTAHITSSIVTLVPGEETGRHKHPVPAIGHILQGTLAISYDGRDDVIVRAGESVVEAIDIWHNGRVVGDEPVRILVTFVRPEGQEVVIVPD